MNDARQTAAEAVMIGPADDSQMAACRLLMPEVFLSTWAPELFVAWDGDRVVGAAAVGWVTGGFPVQAHVAPPWRRRGIGRALMQAVVAATAYETPALIAWSMLEEAGPAAAFLAALGFAAQRRFVTFETDGRQFATMIRGLRDRLAKAGRIPADARIVRLRDAPTADVTALVSREFGAMPAIVAAKIAAEAGGYDRDRSAVLLRGGRVAGAMLQTRQGSVADIEVNAVVPSLRRGWANVLLLDATANDGLADGVTRFRFWCDERIKDTVNLGRRTGATMTEPRVMLTRVFPTGGAAVEEA